jgi:hypothetical protein
MTHSLGVPSGIVASALNAEMRSYPLAGLVISSIGTEWDKEHRVGMQDMLKEKPATITFPNDFKDTAMLGSREEGMADPSIYDQTEVLQDVMYFEECAEMQTQWLDYWQEYAVKVNVPVMYALAEKDWLWTVSEQHVRDFAGAFRGSPRVESGLVLGTAHCMELSRVGRGWYARAFGFSLECAVALDLRRRSVL